MFAKLLSDLKKLLYNKSMISAFFVLAILGFTFGYYFTEMIDKKHEYKKMDVQENIGDKLVKDNDGESNTVVKDLNNKEIIISDSTVITYEREYAKSNEVDEETQSPEVEMLGLNKDELKQLYKEWDIKTFDDKEVVLHKKIDSYSPRFYKVGVAQKNQQEYIAVFNFNKEGEEVIDYISDTPISILNENEKNNLKKGVIFGDIEEVHRMLENYDG